MLDLGVIELVLVVGLFLLAGAARHGWTKPFRKFEKRFDAIARRRAPSILFVVLLCLGARLMLLPLIKIPVPGVHDEFSYLLAADTFASGRLTNSTHLMWMHFETFHVNQRPTYQSMYQPAQGLVLAAGKVLFGHPWFGVWLSTGIMCGAIAWAIYGWLPPRWALLGGLIATMRLGIFSYWMNSYWGGAIPAIGGALVVGALPRLMRSVRSRDALCMAMGIVILAYSRPYEGMVLSAVALSLLVRSWWTRPRQHSRQLFLSAIVPMAAVLVLAGFGLMYYYWRVTGNPLQMPYELNRATYAVSPPFYWQRFPPVPVLHHKVMSDYYLGKDLDWYAQGLSVSGFLSHLGTKIQVTWLFFLGPILLIPVAMFFGIVRDRRIRPVVLIMAIGCLSLVAETWPIAPHYVAPFTAAIYVPLLQGIRHWRLTQRWTAGPLMAWGVPLICAFMLVARMAADVRPLARYLTVEQNAWWCYIPGGIPARDRILRELGNRTGEHLVLVRYHNLHPVVEEWVYNGANIDSQKAVWARDMGEVTNRELLEYYKDRDVWIVDADARIPKLIPMARDLSDHPNPANDNHLKTGQRDPYPGH